MKRMLCLTRTGFLWVLLAGPSAWAQVADPSNVTAVPRYDANISIVVGWQDNSANEDNFEIHRREVGGTFAFGGAAGANVTQWVDTTATSDKSWEYRVRARSAAAGNSNWVGPTVRMSPKQQWPMPDGDHDILHSFGTPLNFGGNQYFHEGVDISASDVRVDAGRGGIVSNIGAGAGGTVALTVDMGVTGTVGESYLHITADPALSVGDVLAPGDRVGTVRDDWFNRAVQADHVHWGSSATNKLIPFVNAADRDPNQKSPVVADINNDSDDFYVVDANNNDHTNPREPAWGDVDFIVDAYDDMAANLNLQSAPFSLGYWIEPGVAGGGSVQSAASPYKLVQFDFQLHGAAAAHADETAAVYFTLDADIQGLDTWQTSLSWIITNTNNTTGAKANMVAAEFWRTDARAGSGAKANASDAARARENQEARFPDGRYRVHVMLADLVNTSDTVRSLLVDNSRPYVKSVKVLSGSALVYASEWQWNSGAAQLQINPATFDAASAFPAARTRNLAIEVEFSEPMETALIQNVAPLGTIPTLTSEQFEGRRTIWRGTISHLDIADDGSDDGQHTVTIAGTDLAGNTLLQLADRTALNANNHNRDGAGNLRGAAGNDSVHGFEIGALEGELAVTAIFVRSAGTAPTTPTIAAKTVELASWLNDYYSEVAYDSITFTVAGDGWYPLSQPLNSYYTTPQTPLVDLVQEAIELAEGGGADLSATDFVLVVTDETVARDEWSTNGGWPYETTLGTRPIASGVLNLASPRARISNLAGRMIGLIDLFAYPEVIVQRPFVGPWSHMADKDSEVHVLGWEKWRGGWLDETGTSTGNLVERVSKPPVANPIANRSFTLSPTDTDDDATKLVAIEIGEDLHYTAEYRRQNGLDSTLPDAGVVITKTNDRVAQGEGAAIVQESPVTANDLNDAPFVVTAPREEFDDVGSGVNIEVLSIDPNQAEIRLNYAVPPFENDVYVAPHDDRWKSLDIWVDAPSPTGAFAANPRTIISAGEKPVIGELNKVIGRVRNFGAADASNFEVELEILEPWGTGGNWRSLKIDSVPLLQGQVNNANHDYLIISDWTPSADTHTCVRLRARTVANDINADNNFTQENIHEFTTTASSPFQTVLSTFQVKNPFSERLPFFFRLDGLPKGWTYQITPERPVLEPDQTINAQVTLQPFDAAPLCSREEVTLTAFAPRVDTLKRAGAITLAVSLKSPASATHESWTDCDCDCPDRRCQIYTRGCTNQPNTRILVAYQDPTGVTRVQYVTTDDEGCFSDILPFDGTAGTWETNVVVEESDCTDGATSIPIDVTVRPQNPDRCPDLIVEKIDRPRFDGDTGESVITAVIRNVGKGTAGASIARLVDPSTSQPTGAPYNATAAVGELRPGRRQTVEFRLPYWIYNPDALAEVTADYKNMVQECDEGNNKAVFEDIG